MSTATITPVMSAERSLLPVEITDLLARVPRAYLRDLATDLAWAALIAPRRSDVLYQVVMEWQATLEEIELDGEYLSEVLNARAEMKAGVGWRDMEIAATARAPRNIKMIR